MQQAKELDYLVLTNEDWDWDKPGFANAGCPSQTAQTAIISKYQGSKTLPDHLNVSLSSIQAWKESKESKSEGIELRRYSRTSMRRLAKDNEYLLDHRYDEEKYVRDVYRQDSKERDD